MGRGCIANVNGSASIILPLYLFHPTVYRAMTCSSQFLVGDYSSFKSKCTLTAPAALVIWEYIITLTDEVMVFWAKPLTTTSLLFVFTRWIMMANALLSIIPLTESR